MPRTGDTYNLPAGSLVTDGVDDILASQHNTPLQDIAADLNNPRPLSTGGTGATTAPGARTNLGLGSIATQGANAVAITGGAINGTPVGGTTPSTGAFTDLSASGTLTLPNASVTRAALANSTALSVIGRSANSAGVPADIAAASDHQVMRRSGSAIGFGAVALNQGAAVSGALPVANGGTGGTDQATARAGLGLGTAAVATIMTATGDTGAGRIPRLGDWGIGATDSQTLANIDAFNTPQRLWRVDNSVTTGTLPPTNKTADAVYVLRPSGVQTTQIYSVANNGETYIRKSNGNVSWGPWRLLYESGNLLGTVSQSGGVPTGAAWQYGTASGAYFARNALGIQMCWGSKLVSASSTTVALPAAFVDTAYTPDWCLGDAATPASGGRVASVTTTDFEIFALGSPSFQIIYWHAIGRWF